MRSAESKGIVLSIEALFSLVLALHLLAALAYTHSSNESEWLTVHRSQVLQDVLEVLEKNKGMELAAGWAQGNSTAETLLQGELNEISEETGYCLELSVNGKMISSGRCAASERVVASKRILSTDNGFEWLEAKLS